MGNFEVETYTEKEKMTMLIEALDFYSAPERYKSKNKKIKPRIIQDAGKIARVTLSKVLGEE